MENSSEVKAVIFDMDGVLQDSETISDVTWEIAAQEFHIKNWFDTVTECRGCNKADTITILKKHYGDDFEAESFLERTRELFHKVEESQGIPLMYYAKEILDYLKPKYKLALASSTRGESVRRQMKAAGLIDFFESLTTGDMVSHSKPEPEIYLKAAESIGIKPENCIAVEDSPNGVKSACAAGLRVIMVPDKIQPDENLKKACWKICKNLEEVKNLI